MAYEWKFLVDPTTFLLVAIAAITIFYGSFRSIHQTISFSEGPEIDTNQLKVKTAIILPIVGSIFLILLFYFLHWLIYLLLVLLALSSLSGCSFFFYPAFNWILNKYNLNKSKEVKWIGTVNVAGILSFLFALIMVILWIVLKHFILTDFLAITLAVTALSTLRIPNLKVATVVLWLFFFYDIFWVFLSQYIFKKNVMVTVATQLPELPMVITFPRILDDGHSLLGLGDIVLPGLFLCFLYRFDHVKQTRFVHGYFLRSFIAYIFGLVVTFLMVFALQKGQPALLYLVPCIAFTNLFFGFLRKELKELWRGSQVTEEISTAPTPSVVENGNEEKEPMIQSFTINAEEEETHQ